MNVWTTIALSFTLIACGSSVKEETDAGIDAASIKPPTSQELPDNDGGDWTPCDRRRDVITFKLDGGTFVITVPTLCDPTPYIEKGDPLWQNQAKSL